jgi:hypothetical protein
MSIFDPDSFMSATTEAANDTTVAPVPPGEYRAQIEDLKTREVSGKDGEPRYPMDVTYSILDDNVKATLGRDKVTARQTIWLDLTSQGQIDSGKGKNIGLGKLRAAAGLNKAGQPFAPSMLIGAVVRVTTGLRPDKNDPTIQYTDVKSVGMDS